MVGDCSFVAQRLQQPAPCRVGVGHRLQRGKGFGRHDKECFRRIEIAHCLGEICAVDVGNEAEGHVACAVIAQRLVCHHRPQVGAADANVDDVADALAGEAFPLAAAHTLRKVAHAVKHGVHLRHNILAVDVDMGVARGAQGDMQHGAVLGDVDLVAAEHGVDVGAQIGLFCQLHEQPHGFVGDAVLGVVEVDAQLVDHHAFAAPWINRKEVAQMNIAHLGEMLVESMPGGTLCEWIC